MIRAFVFCSLVLLLSCESGDVEPEETIDGDIESIDLAVELILEGSNAKEVCGITNIDSTENSYHIYFDKNTCTGNIVRDGEIVVTLVKGSTWSEKDAVMKISYRNYEIELLESDGTGAGNFFEKRLLTGDQYIVNVTGGIIDDFLDGKVNYMERKTRGENLSVKFNDNVVAQRYHEASVREFRREGDLTTLISRGDTTINEYQGVQEWGVDVYNQRFHRIVEQPIIKTLCDNGKRWKFTEGTKIIYGRDQFGNDQTTRKIFGVKQDGEPDGTCDSYGFVIKVEKVDGEIREGIYKY